MKSAQPRKIWTKLLYSSGILGSLYELVV